MNQKTTASASPSQSHLPVNPSASRMLRRKCDCGAKDCTGSPCQSRGHKKTPRLLQRKPSASNGPLLAGDFTRTPTTNSSKADTVSPPQSTSGKQNAKPKIILLFGGLWDHTRPLDLSNGPVELGLFPKLLMQHTGVTYWEWTDDESAIDYVKRTATQDTPIEIVGHSYGGDTGIEVANTLKAEGFLVTRVTTLDAVSWSKDKPHKDIEWLNTYVSGIHDASDVIATLGGHYGEQEEAENIRLDDGTTHAQASKLYQAVEEYTQFEEYVNRKLARKKTSDRVVTEVPPIVYDVLHSPGQPLDTETRAFFEPRFGQDFSRVRVHTDSLAAQSASAVNALAYTVGSDLVFATGQFDNRSKAGRHLLAHELTHVVQQSQSTAGIQSEITHDSQGSSAEREAEAAGQAVLSDISSPLTSSLDNAPDSTSVTGGRSHPGSPMATVTVPDNLPAVNSLSGYHSPSQITKFASQRNRSSSILQRQSNTKPRSRQPSIVTMAQFIDLVRKVEASNTGMDALKIAQMIMRTKYHSMLFDLLLPSSAGGNPVSASGSVTNEDVTTLSGEFEVTLPGGGKVDPSHVIVGIIAGSETKPAGGDIEPLKNVLEKLLKDITQLDIATWLGDVAHAAGAWERACPLSGRGNTKQDYMNKYASESDLIADIDGVVMTSRSDKKEFTFNPAETLSSNLTRFYFPKGPREGKHRRFHIFCAVEGFSLMSDNVTLSDAAKKSIDNRVYLNTKLFADCKPDLIFCQGLQTRTLKEIATACINHLKPDPGIQKNDDTIDRANDWRWFADQFKNFVQQNLKSEGP